MGSTSAKNRSNENKNTRTASIAPSRTSAVGGLDDDDGNSMACSSPDRRYLDYATALCQRSR